MIMRLFKKYGAVVLLIMVFPLIGFFAKNFILESNTAIYAHIPQESDVVIEINVRNFITEIGYQRIYNEGYFLEKMYPNKEDGSKKPIPENQFGEMGFDVFSKIILFREQWATEQIWIALIDYTNESELRSFILAENPAASFAFGEEYAVVQLSPSENQEKLDEHLKKISQKEIKCFTERVDLSAIFDPSHEINCYIIPQVTHDNQLTEGVLSFDFLTDHIEISGNFTPIPSFDLNESIAYTTDNDVALSIRSCLNIFTSIYWFNQERIENVPDYSQLAFDYNGINCYLVKRSSSSSMPFKSFPQLKLAFDISEPKVWYDFFDSLQTNEQIVVDTLRKELYTKENAFFRYELKHDQFKLMQAPFTLTPNDEQGIYFDLNAKIDPLLDNTKIFVDDKNPPSLLQQKIIPVFAQDRIDALKSISSIESIKFQLKQGKENLIIADGRINMRNKNGQSMVESISFGAAFVAYLEAFGL